MNYGYTIENGGIDRHVWWRTWTCNATEIKKYSPCGFFRIIWDNLLRTTYVEEGPLSLDPLVTGRDRLAPSPHLPSRTDKGSPPFLPSRQPGKGHTRKEAYSPFGAPLPSKKNMEGGRGPYAMTSNRPLSCFGEPHHQRMVFNKFVKFYQIEFLSEKTVCK